MIYHSNFISKRKTKSLIGFLLLIAFSVVVSCDKDDDEPTENSPVLNLIEPATTDFQIGPGEPFTLSVTANSNANSNASLTIFKVEKNFNDTGYETVIDSVISTNQFELQNYQCQASNGFGTEDWMISIQDANGETNSITLNTTIESNAPAVQFLTGEYQPGMNYVADDITFVINQPFVFGISAIAVPGSNLKSIHIERLYESISSQDIFDTITNESTFEKSIQTVANPSVGQEEFICTVTDENDNTSTISFKVTTILTDPGISVYTGISLGSWNSTTNSSFASITGQTYGIAEAAADSIQSKIDWVYFNGSSYGNTLMSPSDTLVEDVYPSIENWTVRNQTRFTKTTYGPDIFDIIENDNQLIVFINTGNLNFVYDFYSELLSNPGGFAVNDVLAFETHTGKYGFIKITAVNPGTSNDLSTITYDLKVMK